METDVSCIYTCEDEVTNQKDNSSDYIQWMIPHCHYIWMYLMSVQLK